MENDINTLKLIDMASAHLKVHGIESGIVPMPGTDKSIIIGSPAEVVELMPELRGAIPAAWHNFARAIANLPHGAEANIAGMQSKAAQLLAAGGARGKVLPKDEGAVASVGRQLDFRPSEQYSAWFTVNRSKLRNHSIFTKGAVIWNAARAAHPVAASAGIEGLTRYVLDGNSEIVAVKDAHFKCSGEFVYVSDVERLLATQSAKQGAQQAEANYKLIQRTIIGLRDGWGTRADADTALAALCAGYAAPAAPLQTMDDTTRNEAWRPILTVPMDGSEVLLYLGAPYSSVVKARWFDVGENWIEGEFPDVDDEYCGIGSRVPTHWMPLPEAPTAIRALMKSASPVSGEAGEKGGELQAVAAFLMGEADLEGVTFGERHPTKAGAFWWRHNLRAALHAAGLRPERKDQG